jgi:hypothetical protein
VRDFDHTQRLTDGGVYDNLGIDSFIGDESQFAETIIISDAEGNFDSDFEAKYTFPVTRNVRASDLLMKRVSALRLSDLSSPHVRIKIRNAVEDSSEAILSPDSQRALINVRTDLDAFTALEITALITHGFNKARETLIENGLIDFDTPGASWDPLGNLNQLPDRSVSEKLRKSRIRAWRLWSKYDPISWATGLYAAFVIALLAAPTAFLVYRSAQDAIKTTLAQQEAVAAQLEAARAQQAAAISQANAIFADAKAAEASALVTGILGGRSSPWKLKGIGDCTRQDTSSSEGEFPLDQICTQGGAKSAVCWDGITFKNSGGFKYAAAWCTYKTTSAAQCSGGSSPGRLYECAPPSGIEPALKNVSVCVGDIGCPPAAIHLPCGTSVQEFASDKCLTSTITRVSSKVGNVCATDIFDVACAPKPPAPPPPPQPAKTEVTRPLKVCTGEYERACDPHDSYLYCYADVKGWANARCEKSTVTQLNDRGGNKCGYQLYEVLCTSSVK